MIRDERALNGFYTRCVTSNEIKHQVDFTKIILWIISRERERTAEKSCGMLETRSKTITNNRHHYLLCCVLCRSFSFDFNKCDQHQILSKNLFKCRNIENHMAKNVFTREERERITKAPVGIIHELNLLIFCVNVCWMSL